MTEAHQQHFALLHPLDKARDILHIADFGEHTQHFFVGPPVQRTVQRRRRAGHGAVRIGVARSNVTHHRSGAVLLVVGVQNEEHIQRLGQHRVRFVIALIHIIEHVNEVGRVAQLVVGVVVRAANAMTVGKRRHGGQLAQDAPDVLKAQLFVVDLLGVWVEGGKRRQRRDQEAHRVCVIAERLHQPRQVFVDVGVVHHLVLPVCKLVFVGQMAKDQQVGHFQKTALFRQLFNGVTAVLQNAIVAVDVGDAALTRSGVGVSGVVGHHAEVFGFYF